MKQAMLQTGKGFEDIPGATGRSPICETTLYLAGRGSIERIRGAFFRQAMFAEFELATHDAVQRGEALFQANCAFCHGDRGEGTGGAYPPLAGNRAVTLPVTANLVQVVIHGAFGPSTEGRPRPYGMPPFAMALSDADVAAVLTYMRQSWGNRAAAVSELEVAQQRSLAR